MTGRSLRARAPVNYAAEAGGTNTPGWLKSKTTPRVLSSEEATGAALTADTDKENKPSQQKHDKKSSPTTTGGRSEGKKGKAAAQAEADSKKPVQANKRAGKKNAAAKSAEVKADQSPAAPAGKPDVKQNGQAMDTVDLLTPVDLIKKSSANRAKQKQNAQEQQQPAAEQAPAETAKTAPGGKKVASRGINANLQVVEVEPKAKRSKRKAASESAEQLAASNSVAGSPDASEQPEEDAFLPNKKRSKQNTRAPPQSSAAAGVPDLEPSEAGKSALRDVPGLPGVKHQMPKLTAANTAKNGTPTEAGTTAAASASHSQSGPTRSNNSKRQASSGKAAAAKTATAAQAEASSGRAAGAKTATAVKAEAVPVSVQPEVKATGVVDKPADRSVDVAMQTTLASAGTPQGMQFHRLQEEYAQLQQKYADLKERKIQDLDGMLEEHTAKLTAHNETAVKLADHWRQEAHRQAAFAQAAGAPAMQAELKAGKEEVQKLKAALLEQEAAVLQRERQMVDLRRQLKEAHRRAEGPLQMDQAVQAQPSQQDFEMQLDASSLAELRNQGAAQQQQQSPAVRSTVHSTGSEATPAPATALVKKKSMHLEEAKEMCPEGHELSESYRPRGLSATPSGDGVHVNSSAKPLVPYPVGISGQGLPRQAVKSRLANSQSAEGPHGTPHGGQAGMVHIHSSAKPLVPYPVGISVQPQTHTHRQSRFAEEGMTPHPIRDVSYSPQEQVEQGKATAAVEEEHRQPADAVPKSIGNTAMVPRAVALAQAAAVPLPASPADAAPGNPPARSSGNAQAVGRLLEFASDARPASPCDKGETDAEAGQAMEADMSLTGSAKDEEQQLLGRNALHALMGLEATPIKAGGFKYLHRDTGLMFEIAPATPDSAGQDSEADSGEPELCFNPVSLGQAVEMLPSYLHYEIKFGASQRQILVGRIMEALGRCKTVHRNVEG